MRRNAFLILVMVLAMVSSSVPAVAWVFVPSYGDTGWQSFSFTADSSGFTGIAGFVVSNELDMVVDSFLLLDNLSQAGAAGNQGFELGDYTGYTLGASSNGSVITGPITALSGNVYNPTEGTHMSVQESLSDDTSAFLNAFGNPGTDGSILETAISLAPNESFSFDWAFLTTDYTPFQDFSLFYLIKEDLINDAKIDNDDAGQIVYTEGLGQLAPVAPVPEPSTLFLVGAGLMGVGLLRRRSKK